MGEGTVSDHQRPSQAKQGTQCGHTLSNHKEGQQDETGPSWAVMRPPGQPEAQKELGGQRTHSQLRAISASFRQNRGLSLGLNDGSTVTGGEEGRRGSVHRCEWEAVGVLARQSVHPVYLRVRVYVRKEQQRKQKGKGKTGHQGAPQRSEDWKALVCIGNTAVCPNRKGTPVASVVTPTLSPDALLDGFPFPALLVEGKCPGRHEG